MTSSGHFISQFQSKLWFGLIGISSSVVTSHETQIMALPKLIVFGGAGYTTTSQEFLNNDPNLVLNESDFVVGSAIAVVGNWTLYDDVGFVGTAIVLSENAGPELDGCFKDYADWAGGTAPFHVKSIQHS